MASSNIARLAAALLIAAAAATAVPALAGEGNGPDYPGLHTPDVVIGTVTFGSAAGYATQRGGPVIGGTLPSNSNSSGEPEPINSLPRGFENGMPGLMRQQALDQYQATHR